VEQENQKISFSSYNRQGTRQVFSSSFHRLDKALSSMYIFRVEIQTPEKKKEIA
jgi:hypothetical protein